MLKNLPCAERGFSFFRNRAAAAEAGKHPVHPQSSTAEPGAGCWVLGAEGGSTLAVARNHRRLEYGRRYQGGNVFALSNYSLTFLVVGLLFSILAIARARNPLGQAVVVEKLLAWHVFWAIGVGYLYNFVMHAFFGQMSAAFIGWADSPFQFEVATVATASLGFAVVGFLAAFRSCDLRLAAIVGPSFFMLVGAAGHVYQMATENNFAPGNAGVIFYTDIIIPLLGLVLLWLQHRCGASVEKAQLAPRNLKVRD
jgi:hypothetical protein